MRELHRRPGPMGGTIATMRRAVLVTVVLIGLLVASGRWRGSRRMALHRMVLFACAYGRVPSNSW